MVFLIIAAIILILGGIAVALQVSIGTVLLILLGIFLFIGIIGIILNKTKSQKKQNIITIIAFILIIALCIFLLVKCFTNTNSGDDDWDKCLKCNGSGKITNENGFIIKCPRCNGVGYIP